MATIAFATCEQSNFNRFHIDDEAAKRSILATRTLIESATSCRLELYGERTSPTLTVSFVYNDRKRRRAAAIYVYYRSCLDASHQPRRGNDFKFDDKLLDATLARIVWLPEMFDKHTVRTALYTRDECGQNLIYLKCKELGALVDMSSFDQHRKIQLLSSSKVARDRLCDWIKTVAESTMSPQAPPEPVMVPATPATPLLSARLALRTVKTLVDMGFDEERVSRTVDGLPDKGDVQAATNKMLDPSYVAAVAVTIEAAAAEETLSDATTHLSLASPERPRIGGCKALTPPPDTDQVGRLGGAECSGCATPPTTTASESALNGPPDHLLCPISIELMVDPVLATDGHTYERREIEAWLKTKQTSPMTGEPLETTQVFPNHNLRRQIREWQEVNT